MSGKVPEKIPRTRGGCADVPRPCPFASCRYSLRTEVSEGERGDMRVKKGAFVRLRVYREDVQESDEWVENGEVGADGMPVEVPVDVPAHESCALDVADRGDHSLEEIADLLGGMTRERVRQIEEVALGKLRREMAKVGISPGLFGRESSAVPGDAEDEMSGAENLAALFRNSRPIEPPPVRVVQVTADGRRVGDRAPGKIRRNRRMALYRYNWVRTRKREIVGG